MSTWFKEGAPISARDLTEEFQRLKRGSVTRRHFLAVTGLGLAAAVLARQPGLFNSTAHAQEGLGSIMSLATQKTLESSYVMRTFGRSDVEFVGGRGMTLVDAEGREYLDFLAGIGVCCLGHGHPAVTGAVREQAERLMHVSNYFYIEHRGDIAGVLPLYAASVIRRMEQADPQFVLRSEGRTRINRQPGYQIQYQTRRGGRTTYGRRTFLFADEPAQRDGADINLLAARSPSMPNVDASCAMACTP